MSNLSKARKDNKGAGIGLLLVKGFKKNDGEIWVESKEGIGSTFFLRFRLMSLYLKSIVLIQLNLIKGNLF
jgi:signal transduction histidine kinase